MGYYSDSLGPWVAAGQLEPPPNGRYVVRRRVEGEPPTYLLMVDGCLRSETGKRLNDQVVPSDQWRPMTSGDPAQHDHGWVSTVAPWARTSAVGRLVEWSASGRWRLRRSPAAPLRELRAEPSEPSACPGDLEVLAECGDVEAMASALRTAAARLRELEGEVLRTSAPLGRWREMQGRALLVRCGESVDVIHADAVMDIEESQRRAS